MARTEAAKSAATHEQVFVCIFGQTRGELVGILDMLRYDSCVPADEGQSMKLMRDTGETWVILKRFAAVGAALRPSVDRWRSYGWECLQGTFKSFGDAEQAAVEHEARKVRDAANRLKGTAGA